MPSDVPLMRFCPAAGESITSASVELGVVISSVANPLAVTGSTPLKAIALPATAKLPEPLVAAG